MRAANWARRVAGPPLESRAPRARRPGWLDRRVGRQLGRPLDRLGGGFADRGRLNSELEQHRFAPSSTSVWERAVVCALNVDSGLAGIFAAMLVITGRDLDPAALAMISRDAAPVRLDPEARARVEAAHALVEHAAREGTPVYGVTTGLGSRVVHSVDGSRAAAFSLRTLRGRAMAVGPPLDRELTRAAMAVRLNGICAGGSGASVAVADGLAALLNAGVHPSVPRTGSVGAADLCMMAHLGLGLIGEGEAELDGERMAAAQALARAGLAPVTLGTKDGLAICSSAAVSIGAAALALLDCEACLAAAQVSAALSMEGLRANLSPIDPRVVAARSAPGQAWAADGLWQLLAGGSLADPGAARRLQDPLSFRCASQIHGALHMALDLLAAALGPELNAAADNPLVLVDDREILSTGNFHVPALAVALDATALAIAQMAAAIGERPARLRNPQLSGLPANLVAAEAGDVGAGTHSGVAPLLKTAQALALEIRHLAAPLALVTAIGADSVEDHSTGSAQAALRLREQLERLRLLVAIELVVGAQAVELAAPARLGRGTHAAWRFVRELVASLDDDRPLGVDVELVADRALVRGELLVRVAEGGH